MGTIPFDTAFRVQHADGTVKHIQANGYVIRDELGNAVRMLGINRDITEGTIAENDKVQLEAIRLFENDPSTFEVIVTDQTLPGMMGADLAGQAKSIRPGMPAVLRAGYSELIDADSARHKGIAAFVPKPYNRESLAGAMKKARHKGGEFSSKPTIRPVSSVVVFPASISAPFTSIVEPGFLVRWNSVLPANTLGVFIGLTNRSVCNLSGIYRTSEHPS